MTRLFTKTILTAGLSALLGSLTLTAQNLQLVADIPFAFHAEGRTLPAGTYQLRSATTTGVFQISDRAENVSQFVNAPIHKQTNPTSSKLTFARFGNEYVLASVAVAGTAYDNAVSSAAIQKNMTRKLDLSAMISVPLHQR